MTDRRDSDDLRVIGQLVDDAVAADPQRAQPSQPAAKCMARVRLAREQSERVLDGVDQ